MELERVSVALRPRSSWEAIDLGLQLVRRFAASVFMAWLAIFVPVAVLLHGVLAFEPGIAFVVVWWLRPLFDRAVLAVLGPAVFGAAPEPRAILRRWPSFVAELFAAPLQLLASLTWRRFNPWRSYVLPVDVLERLSLGERRARVAILSRNHRDVASGLTVLCMALEITLYVAQIAFLALLVPEAYDFDLWGWLFDSDTMAARVAQIVLLGIAHSVVEPFYVAGGFGLYLNRRIELEGWDLELAFRRLVTRRRLMSAAVLACALALAPGAEAASASREPDPQDVVERVLGGEEFSDFEEEWVWRWKRGEAEAIEDDDISQGPDLSFLNALGKAFAKLFFFVGILALSIVVVLILRSLFRHRTGGEVRGRAKGTVPTTLFGLELDRASLPADVVGAARAAWSHDPRLALSLLYRGALAHLVHRRGLRIAESATEGECVWVVRQGIGDLADDFESLTRIWQRLAYGRRIPDEPTFEALAARWGQILAPADEEAA